MLEVASRVERLADTAAVGAVGTAAASRARGWAVSLETPAAVAPGEAWFLSFRNFYAASARVELVLAGGQAAALAGGTRSLMRRLHAENDAQDWHLIALQPAGMELAGKTIVGVRVFCRQPSPLWASCELHSLQLFRHEAPRVYTSTPSNETCSASNPSASRTARRSSATDEQVAEATREASLERPDASSVDGQAVRCLDLALRLRQLLARLAASPY